MARPVALVLLLFFMSVLSVALPLPIKTSTRALERLNRDTHPPGVGDGTADEDISQSPDHDNLESATPDDEDVTNRLRRKTFWPFTGGFAPPLGSGPGAGGPSGGGLGGGANGVILPTSADDCIDGGQLAPAGGMWGDILGGKVVGGGFDGDGLPGHGGGGGGGSVLTTTSSGGGIGPGGLGTGGSGPDFHPSLGRGGVEGGSGAGDGVGRWRPPSFS